MYYTFIILVTNGTIWICDRLFKEKVLLNDNTMPSSHREAKKLLEPVSLPSLLIDACVNDCEIFYGKLPDGRTLEDMTTCPHCGAQRRHKNILNQESPRKVISQFDILIF
jgi:hypothetical protein